jgi:hypothetical protein
VLQGVDDVALDAKQSEFEDLEQAGGAGADDQGIGLEGGGRGAGYSQGGNLRQNSANSSGSVARPHEQMVLRPGRMRVYRNDCGRFGLKAWPSLDKFSSLTHIKADGRVRQQADSAPDMQERR